MSISQRTDGRFAVKYKDDFSGKWKQRSFRTREDAEKFQGEVEYDRAKNSRLTVLEAVLVYLKNVHLCAKTIRIYQFVVLGRDNGAKGHEDGPAEFLATRYVDTLNRRDLENVREMCRQRGVTPATINIYVGKLKSAFNWCVQQDLLHENPWAKYRGLPEKHKARTGTLDDLRKVYPLLPQWMQWAVKTALALCLRPGLKELFGLTWDAFNWRTGTVTVYMPKVDNIKLVYPPDSYLSEARERFKADQAHGHTLVCRDKNDRPVTKEYTYTWGCSCKRAGVSMPMYALRHIAATEMLAAGADLAAVAAQLGHKDMTTTGVFYAHALPGAQRKAAIGLPEFGVLDAAP